MNRKVWGSVVGCCVLLMVVASANAQVKEKPPMYSYVANWVIPRAQWGELEKASAADQKILDQALANGTLVGYGSDMALIHTTDGETHDDWWSSMSMSGLITVLDQIYSSGNATSPVLTSATKHWDNIYVSKYYDRHPGTIKGGFTYVAAYKLKADAPDDAVDTLSKNVVAPILDKLFADGTLFEYEIDTQAVHTDAPGLFSIVYIAAKPDGIDKVNAAIKETIKSSPLSGPAFGSMVDYTVHRDFLARTNAIYK